MECIDIDKMMREFTNSPLHDNSHNTVDELNVLLKMIDEAEIIECQPVVHAEWKYYKNNGIYDYYKCSHCNFEVRILEDNIKELGNYCSHCGSRMDKE